MTDKSQAIELSLDEQRIIGIAISFLLFDMLGRMDWQKSMMDQEMQFVSGHQNAMYSALQKVREGCKKASL